MAKKKERKTRGMITLNMILHAKGGKMRDRRMRRQSRNSWRKEIE